MLEMAIVENIQRKDLNAIEIGLSYQRLIDECNLTHEQLSLKLSKNRSTITNFLRLLKLPIEVQKGLRDSKISMGHARALLSLNNETEIINAFKKIISESLNVRDTEEMYQKKKFKNLEKSILSSYELRMQNNISFQLKSKVKIQKKTNGKGQLVITFKNQDQLNEILDNFDQ
jgi:ParB family chromosome partitioning protein